MRAKYIIRLDDASEYMHPEKWDKYFRLFDKYEIKPIISVIPSNKDPQMTKSLPDENFWDLVKTLKTKGYCIAMHGFDHVYLNSNGGLLNINRYSEFAGLSLAQQKEKLKKAQNIFEQHSIYPEIFVAPGHSFDKNTIAALKEVTTIKIISDGYANKGYKKFGINWIPQQLWGPKHKYFGLWTICIHPEICSDDYFIRLENFIARNSESIERYENIVFKNLNILDYFFIFKSKLFYTIKPVLKKMISFFFPNSKFGMVSTIENSD